MNMQELTGTEIIVRATGEVQESNLSEFEAKAKAVLSSINTKLVTDDDFANAKEDIKSCKTVETRLANISSDITHGMTSVSEAVTLLGNLHDQFRDTRLKLNKLVTTEEAKRKKEIVDNGLENLHNRVASSPVKHGFTFDRAAVYDAIKGKRSLEKMDEAVNEVVAAKINRLILLEQLYESNLSSILLSEADYPGLFPDKHNLALEPEDVVETKIAFRIEKFKNDQREAEERKKREEALKAEEAEVAQQPEAAAPVSVEPPPIPKTIVPPPLPPDPFTDRDFSTPNPEPVELIVTISGFVHEDIVINRIKAMTEVLSVERAVTA